MRCKICIPALVSTALILVAVCPIRLSAQENPSPQQQLERAEREYGYELVRAYIDYAERNEGVSIPVVDFPNYFVRKTDQFMSIYTHVADSVAARLPELSAAWNASRSYQAGFTKRFYEDAEYRKLVEDCREKKISRKDFSKKGTAVIQRIYRQYPEVARQFRKYMEVKELASRNCLQIILDDHVRRREEIPIGWIPEEQLPVLKKAKNVKKAAARVSMLKRKL